MTTATDGACCEQSDSSNSSILPVQETDSIIQTNAITKLDVDSTTFEKLCIISGIASPLIASYFFRTCESLIVLYFAGILAKRADNIVIMAGVSMSCMFYNVSFTSVIIGMATALDTLGSQYNGAQNHVEVVLVVQRSFVVMTLMLIPILTAWYFVADIFTAVGVDAHTCGVMKTYLTVMLLAVPGRMSTIIYRKYLMCMGITWPQMNSALFMDITLAICCYLFVLHFDYGIQGLAFASVMGTYAGLIYLIGCSLKLPEVQRSMSALPFFPFHRDAFDYTRIIEYATLGFPGLIMICAEWWAYEFLTVFASLLGPDAVTAQALIFQLNNLTFCVPACVGMTTNILVGNAVGAFKINLAIDLSTLCLRVVTLVEIVVIMPIILLAGGEFIKVYSIDDVVMHESLRAIPILTIAAFGEGMQSVVGGILRGTGNQKIGAYANLLCFYAIGIPLAFLFCFHLKLRVAGLILGLSCGMTVQAVSLMAYIVLNEQQVYSTKCCRSDVQYTDVSLGSDSDGGAEDSLDAKEDGDIELKQLIPSTTDMV